MNYFLIALLAIALCICSTSILAEDLVEYDNHLERLGINTSAPDGFLDLLWEVNKSGVVIKKEGKLINYSDEALPPPHQMFIKSLRESGGTLSEVELPENSSYKIEGTGLTAMQFSFRKKNLPLLVFEPKRPDRLSRSENFPAIVFLHGNGGRGKNYVSAYTDGNSAPSPFISKEFQSKHPCFVIIPQSSEPWQGVGKASDDIFLTTLAISYLRLMKYPLIDPDRIYVTGLSSGGVGSIDAIRYFPQQYAAGVIVSASVLPEIVIDNNSTRPVWSFVNELDNDLRDRNMKLKKEWSRLGGDFRITTYRDKGGHNAWTQTYGDAKFQSWLFSKKR